jgi:hypothetical protein
VQYYPSVQVAAVFVVPPVPAQEKDE